LPRRKEELAATKYLKSLGPAGIKPNSVELKAERRKPSGEKHCDIEDIPSLTGVLAHFRLH
jgi:hypothetical protein